METVGNRQRTEAVGHAQEPGDTALCSVLQSRKKLSLFRGVLQ